MQPIEVFIRMTVDSATPMSGGTRPSWFSKEVCFQSVWNYKDDYTRITVLFDGDIPENHWIFNYCTQEKTDTGPPLHIVNMNAGSGHASLLLQLAYATSQSLDDNTIVYILEDDYLHCPDWPKILREGLTTSHMQPAIPFDYITLYDHRDKYTLKMYEGLVSQIAFTESCHWRTIPSTTDTFACRFKTLKTDAPITAHFYNADHERFLYLGRHHGRRIGSCIPAYSTHAHSDFISPCMHLGGNRRHVFAPKKKENLPGKPQDIDGSCPIQNSG